MSSNWFFLLTDILLTDGLCRTSTATTALHHWRTSETSRRLLFSCVKHSEGLCSADCPKTAQYRFHAVKVFNVLTRNSPYQLLYWRSEVLYGCRSYPKPRMKMSCRMMSMEAAGRAATGALLVGPDKHCESDPVRIVLT